MSPDSRFSEWRMILGTRGLVTTLVDSTGSVGDSRAPTRKLSVQVRPASSLVASATITAVSGIASASLRNGRCQWDCSISPSTSRPSRNRITISATVARSPTNSEWALKCTTSSPPSPSTNPASTNSAVSESALRWAMPDSRAPPISRQPNTSKET